MSPHQISHSAPKRTCVCVCVCVCERERERERECVCANIFGVDTRVRARMCVCVCVCVCVRERESRPAAQLVTSTCYSYGSKTGIPRQSETASLIWSFCFSTTTRTILKADPSLECTMHAAGTSCNHETKHASLMNASELLARSFLLWDSMHES